MQTTSIAMIRRRYPGCRINLFSYLPKDDRRLLNENEDKHIHVYSATPYSLVFVVFPLALLARMLIWVGLRTWAKALPFGMGAIAASDGFIDLSGVSFMDERTKFLPYNFLTHLPPLLCDVPLLKLSQAMGPFSKRIVRLVSDLILPRCALVVSRGETTSRQIASRYGDRIKHRTASDIAFLYHDRFSLTKEGVAEADSLAKKLQALKSDKCSIIGICPSAVVYKKFAKLNRDYIGFLIEMLSALRADGNQIVIFPNATRAGAPQSPFNNDLFVLHKLKGSLGCMSADFHWVDWDVNTSSIRTIIRATDTCIVSRFHAMVAALSEGVPIAVFGWSHKYVEVMKAFRMENFVYDYSDLHRFSEDAFCNVVTELLAVRRDEIHGTLREVRISAESQFDALFPIIPPTPEP